jgi:hypothetical protein
MIPTLVFMNHHDSPVDMLDANADYVVTAYDYFESKMRRICARLTGISGPMAAAEARKLIRHHAQARFPDDRIWQELMMLKKIRNVLLSGGGRVEERGLLVFCLKRKIIQETTGIHRLEITPAYKALVRETVLRFFDDFRELNE